MFEKPKAIHALTSIRFIASTAVVLYHFSGILPLSAAFKQICSQGRTGVSFFFVLSGFILTYVYWPTFSNMATREQFGSFMRARIARTYPLHAISLLIITPLIVYEIIQSPPTLPGFSVRHYTHFDIVASWLSNLVLVQAYIPNQFFQHLWNQPSWSISTELSFYLILPLFIQKIGAYRNRPTVLIAMACAFYAIELLMFLVFSLLALKYFGSSASLYIDLVPYRMPMFRIWEFLIGSICGVFFVSQINDGRSKFGLTHWLHQAKWRNIVLGALMVLVVFISSIHGWNARSTYFIELLRWYVGYTPVFALMILCLASGQTFLSPLLDRPWMRLLGEASYALYIFHWLPFIAIYYLMVGGYQPTLAQLILLIVLMVGMSILVYKYIEVPVRRRLTAQRSMPLSSLKT